MEPGDVTEQAADAEVEAIATREERMRLIEQLQASVAEHILPGPCAARSQDFLYDEDGLPG